MYQCFTADDGSLYSPPVDWKTIRARYAALFQAAKDQGVATQETVAEKGGIRQPDISRMLSNRDKGPSVETFVRCIEGLGLRPSEFFRGIEDGPKTAIEKSKEKTAGSGGTEDNPHGGSFPHTAVDTIALESIVIAAVETLSHTIDGAINRLGARLEQIASTRAQSSSRRARDSSRTRKTG